MGGQLRLQLLQRVLPKTRGDAERSVPEGRKRGGGNRGDTAGEGEERGGRREGEEAKDSTRREAGSQSNVTLTRHTYKATVEARTTEQQLR